MFRHPVCLTLALTPAASACADHAHPPAASDRDADGFTVAQGDCDDLNRTAYPGAVDHPGDGVDQDCDGADAAPVPPPLPEDVDRDGYAASAGDCDDLNRTAYPGAVDHPGDGVDQDCDGADASALPPAPPEDVDRDGVTTAAGDCDDLNRTIFPGARERAYDGVDQDCDGDERPVLGEDRYAEALGRLDADGDGDLAFEEFAAACAVSASPDGLMRPGVVQTHAVCAGTVAGRGMHLHPWKQLFVHDCRGVNYCAAWSCTELGREGAGAPGAAAGEIADRTGAEVWDAVGCGNCHTGGDEASGLAFKLLVPPGTDLAATAAAFPAREDERLRAAIAFGVAGTSPGGVAFANMPAHFHQLSRGELEAVIAFLRGLPLEVSHFAWGEEGAGMDGMDP